MKPTNRNEYKELDRNRLKTRYVVDYYGNDAVAAFTVQIIQGKPYLKTYFPSNDFKVEVA